MTRNARRLMYCLIALWVALLAGCGPGGVGMGVSSGGARWGGGAAGPDVFVGGGPVY